MTTARCLQWIFPALIVAVLAPSGLAETLTIYSMYNPGEPMTEVTAQVARDFEAATGHTVEITWAGRDVLTKARPLILMGNPPDLVYQSLSELRGALMAGEEPGAYPLDDLLKGPGPDGEDVFTDIFPAGLLDAWEEDGHQYMVPEQFITSGFFYNKTYFEELGIEKPETWDELMSVAGTLKENDVAPFMQDILGEYTAFWPYWTIVRVLGEGALLEAASDPTGATWDEEGYLRALEMVERVTSSGDDLFQQGYEGSTWPAAQASWAQGNGAMILNGSWIVNEVARSAAPSWDPGFFPFPVITEGGPDTLEARMNGWAIPAGSDNPDLAMEFLRFNLQRQYQEMVVEDSLISAARKDVPYPEGLADMQPYVEETSGFHTVYDASQALLPEWYSTLFEPLSIELIAGDITAEEFRERIQRDTISYWERQN